MSFMIKQRKGTQMLSQILIQEGKNCIFRPKKVVFRLDSYNLSVKKVDYRPFSYNLSAKNGIYRPLSTFPQGILAAWGRLRCEINLLILFYSFQL